MTCITTFSGLEFDYSNPVTKSICINDIAQSLSYECRFAGHLPAFYSVAQHSWLLSQLVPDEFAFEALLYNASATYCGDIPSPLKQMLPDYRAIEHQIDAVIREKFGLPEKRSEIVHFYNLLLLANERKALDIHGGEEWTMPKGISVEKIAIYPLLPSKIHTVFMARFDELTGGLYGSENNT
ncbi:HD family hydrolase [Yersinia mollaretii]|uniref:HD family hydrolase n=1 Tax=Yersinia mollaretii TaxID=33060 RepID=UPI00119D6DB2|nr:HD family hydrolase [Yersinia mollaretii]